MRQRKIDHENTVLLGKIMNIMTRKNKSVNQAREVAKQANLLKNVSIMRMQAA
jgi:hypothetical protein